MADFTGYHPIQAKAQIDDFETFTNEVTKTLSDANKLFIDSLSTVWFSPYAVAFGQTYTPKLYNSQAEAIVAFNNTIVKAVAAYNAISDANGAPAIADEHAEMTVANFAPQGKNVTYNDMLDISPDGVVGMDKEKVRAYLQEYKNNLNKVHTQLDNIPYCIAFYDPANEQQNAFKALVNAIKTSLDTLFTDMEASISEHLIDEQDKVVAGAREAASALSGN